LGKIENFLGQQEVPFEKTLELISKSEETVQLQVRREMDMQMRKMMETMMAEMLQERLRNLERENQLEKIRAEIETKMKEQVAAVLQRQFQDLSTEQKERKKLQQQQLIFLQSQVSEGVLKNLQEKSQEPAVGQKKPEKRQPEFSEDDIFKSYRRF
jgi:hypothetical protein